MATVKLQDGKVILKNGKVSCSCCGGECCMYPSVPYFNDEYTIDDLPDEVVMNFFGDTATVSKTENKFTPYEGTFGDNNQASISIDEDEAGPWIVVWGGNSFEAGDCLIKGDGNLTPGNDTIEDQFADTYTIDIDSGALVSQLDRYSNYGWISEILSEGGMEGPLYFSIVLAYCVYGSGIGFGVTPTRLFSDQSEAAIDRQRYFDGLYPFQTGLFPKIGTNETPVGNYPWYSVTATVS